MQDNIYNMTCLGLRSLPKGKREIASMKRRKKQI